jgi:hypothetical protein
VSLYSSNVGTRRWALSSRRGWLMVHFRVIVWFPVEWAGRKLRRRVGIQVSVSRAYVVDGRFELETRASREGCLHNWLVERLFVSRPAVVVAEMLRSSVRCMDVDGRFGLETIGLDRRTSSGLTGRCGWVSRLAGGSFPRD